MINVIWLLLIVLAVIVGGASGNITGVTEGAMNGARTSVELALGLIGFMALWLGLMRVAEESGLGYNDRTSCQAGDAEDFSGSSA